MTIDWDGIQNRIIDLPIKAGNFRNLGMGKEGELLYVDNGDNIGPGMLRKYDMTKRKDDERIPFIC